MDISKAKPKIDVVSEKDGEKVVPEKGGEKLVPEKGVESKKSGLELLKECSVVLGEDVGLLGRRRTRHSLLKAVAGEIDCGSTRSSSCATPTEEMEMEPLPSTSGLRSWRKRHIAESDTDSIVEDEGDVQSARKRSGSPRVGSRASSRTRKKEECRRQFGYRFFEDDITGAVPGAGATKSGLPPATALDYHESDFFSSGDEASDIQSESDRPTASGATATAAAENKNKVAEEVIRRAKCLVHRQADALTDVVKKAGNLKGTTIRTLKEGLAGITQVVDTLEGDLFPTSVSPLVSKNLRLEQEVEYLRRQLAEARAAKPAAKPAANAGISADVVPVVGSEASAFRAQIMRDVGGIVRQMVGTLMKEVKEMISALPSTEKVSSASAVSTQTLPEAGTMASDVPDPPRVGDRGSLPQSETGRAKKKKAKKTPVTPAPSGQPESVATTSAQPPVQATASSWATVVKGKRGKTVSVPEGQPVAVNPPVTKAGSAPSKKAKKTSAPSPSKLKPPRSAAVIITLDPEAEREGVAYANVLAEAKRRIDLRALGIEDMRFRTAITGGKVLEVPGADGAEKADVLASKLREFIPENMAKISRPVKSAEMRISGLDDSVTSEEVVAAVAREGGCQVDQVRVGEVRRTRSGVGTCWVKAPLQAVKKMTVAGRVRIGWVSAKAELLRQRPLRCFRCLEEGHVRASCSHEQDRSGLCYRCGNEGHKAAMCAVDPKCAVCSAQGRPSDHWVGSKACTPPKKRKKQPVKLPNPAGRVSVEGEEMETGR
ncbi:uncharacterized protein LOC128200749 [Galleria mellonella]|uniref:Uncharacterized protein LOC128200749 n=1 Tax=Galleria mellonella TaxID=7137 RepID=A0ABM3MIX1_GALME|nr:uncharacterized protein LOC128200749 [Galleria mellonella]